MIRSFELPDLRLLHRYRNQGIFLETTSALTWGKILVPMRAVFSPLSEALGVFTSVYQAKGKRETLIGQINHTYGEAMAQFNFLTPESAVNMDSVSQLLEDLLPRLGERRAQAVIAEVDERTNTFDILRKLSFSIYARQNIWRVTAANRKNLPELAWREIVSQDEFNARKLYNATVPTMVQQVEPTPWKELRGWVYYEKDEMLGYADIVEGPRGIWMQPFIHPEMENVGGHLLSLINRLKPKERKPVYVCLRSYQAGLSMHLEDIDAQPAATQAVMVRRLTAAIQKASLSPLPNLNGNTEASPTFTKSSSQEQGSGQ